MYGQIDVFTTIYGKGSSEEGDIMMVTFISQCEKKALARTRRVLDAFADRIGDTNAALEQNIHEFEHAVDMSL